VLIDGPNDGAVAVNNDDNREEVSEPARCHNVALVVPIPGISVKRASIDSIEIDVSHSFDCV